MLGCRNYIQERQDDWNTSKVLLKLLASQAFLLFFKCKF
uniref:Uncharacterized protein n=1 Tax=Rhizophora mucronata TaxID=61149 RepID=A0A2P2P9F1_RHIMU